MRPAVWFVALCLARVANAQGPIIKYPQADRLAPQRTGEGTAYKVLSEGELGIRGSKPAVGLTLIEFYIVPDIATWKWSVPIIFVSSNTVNAAASDAKQVAADLLDAFSGGLNGSVSGHREWRGKRTDGQKSITGAYLDFGLISKVNPITGSNSTSSTFYVSVGPHARGDFRLTTKTTTDASDYSGVIHARFALTGNYLVRRPASFAAPFGGQDVHQANAFQFDFGWFPINGASVNFVTFTTAFGNLPKEFKNRWSTGLSIFPK